MITTSAQQAASLAHRLATTHDRNARIRLLHHLLQAINDLDRAATTAVTFYRETERLEEQLQPLSLLAQEMGLIIADPSQPLSIEPVHPAPPVTHAQERIDPRKEAAV